MKNVPDKYSQGQTWFDMHYISVIEIEGRYNVSRQQQRNLYVKGTPPDALYIGATLFYWRKSAEPFFAAYDAKQRSRITNAEEKKEKAKPGRPKKKNKNEFKYTLFGVEYTSNLSIAETEAGWRQHLCQSYPQYFSDVAKQVYIKELMHEHDRAFTDAMMHISTTFSKLRAGAVK